MKGEPRDRRELGDSLERADAGGVVERPGHRDDALGGGGCEVERRSRDVVEEADAVGMRVDVAVDAVLDPRDAAIRHDDGRGDVGPAHVEDPDRARSVPRRRRRLIHSVSLVMVGNATNPESITVLRVPAA
jgi:hypothetical protein